MRRQGRRRFLRGGLALAALGLLPGCGMLRPRAQPPGKIPRIGYPESLSETTYQKEWLDAFREGLRALGYVEGQTIALDIRFADSGGPERSAELLAELVRENVDVIVVRGGATAQRAQRATSTIPIVFVFAGNPIGLGLVASLARPGGNLTGFSLLGAELAPKQLQLLQEAAPGIARVGVLYNADDPSMVLSLQGAVDAAPRLGLQILDLGIRQDQLAAPLAAALSGRVEALWVLGSGFTGQRVPILSFAAQHRLPAMYTVREWVPEGGLMSYGVNFTDLFRRAATYVDKILKGTKPADLPVELPTKFDLVLNLGTARALGLTIPQSVLLQATEVIQ
jgi:putative ABC transport system substrate-binding protein